MDIQDLFNFIVNIPKHVAPFTEWLISPINNIPGAPTPIAFFSLPVFIIIFGLHVAHLVNVISG